MSSQGSTRTMYIRKTFVAVLVLHALYLYYLLIVPNTQISYYIKGRFCPETYLESRRAAVSTEPSPNNRNQIAQQGASHRRVNSIVTSYDEVLRARLLRLIERQAAPDDPEVIGLIRSLLDPPSQHIVKPVRTIVETPQSKEVVKVLNSKVS